MRSVRSWLAAWVAGAVLWMLLVDSVRLVELFAGAAVAAIGATAFEVVRRQRVVEQAIHLRRLLRAWRVLVRIPSDVWRLTRAAFAQASRRRPVRGVVISVPFSATGEDPAVRGERAVAVAAGSISPNTIVIGVDADSGRMLLHQLEPTREMGDLDPLGMR